MDNPALEETITLIFPTQNAAGAATNADSTPVVVVYESGVALALSPTVSNPATGLYSVAIPCTAANGFEAGKSYGAYVTATIAGQSTNGVLENWQMRTYTVDTLTTLGNAIKAKTDLIVSGAITIVSPVSADGTSVTLQAGDDYKAADSRAVTFTFTDAPDLTAATVVMRVNGQFDYTFTVSSATVITRDFTKTETLALGTGANPVTLDFQIVATLSNADVVTIAKGVQADGNGMTILPRIPSA